MRKFKQYLAIGCTVMMVVTSAGCSSTTSSDAVEETTQTETEDIAQDGIITETETTEASAVFGKVTAVDESTITLALGETPQGNNMGSKGGRGGAPTGDAATGEAPSGEAPSGEAPSGQVPGTDGQVPDMSAIFKESGKTLTITVDDESIIKLVSGTETTTGSLSDITVDTILSIEYDDSDNITSIIIQTAGK